MLLVIVVYSPLYLIQKIAHPIYLNIALPNLPLAIKINFIAILIIFNYI